MHPTVVFPDAVSVVVGHLDGELDATVGSRVPNPLATPLVVVRRTGGPRLNLVADNPTLTVEAWADTEEAAHDLAQLARAHVAAMPGRTFDGVAVYRFTEVAGPGSLPDPLSDKPRFTLTVQLAMRGTALEE